MTEVTLSSVSIIVIQVTDGKGDRDEVHALNTWTNYINVVAGTNIDFPVVSARKAA
jgi:hypothetical protein